VTQHNVNKDLLSSRTSSQWEKIGTYPHNGIALPLSSLHTKQSSGIGEFFDLVPLIKWCKEMKMDVIQLLPLNDSAGDPSPYNSISSCALNPVYLSLLHLPYIDTDPELPTKIQDFSQLNTSSSVLYTEVQSHKNNFLRTYIDKYGKLLLSTPKYKQYLASNTWVEAYGLFKTIKATLSQNNHDTWPRELKTPTEEEYTALLEKNRKEISFYILVQYLCFLQLSTVKKIANEHGVFLKGDIPILISPDSVDVWHNPELFILDYCAGAPPDMYNKEGQYWGFPLFNWRVMEKNNYKWWENRLSYANNFYDIYRIDHVIGFFRIWAIQVNCPAKEGKYLPADESLWGPQGEEILTKLISFSSMLPIAEDLGVVPDVVRPILQHLGICSTKVMRWERDWHKDKHFIPLKQYPPISMTCLSTHDSETLGEWWKVFPEEAMPLALSKHWKYDPHLTIDQRAEILHDAHHTSSLFHINLLQEYLGLCPELSWPDVEQDRINIPGKILPTNWTYKFRTSIEEIAESLTLKKYMHKILS